MASCAGWGANASLELQSLSKSERQVLHFRMPIWCQLAKQYWSELGFLGRRQGPNNTDNPQICFATRTCNVCCLKRRRRQEAFRCNAVCCFQPNRAQNPRIYTLDLDKSRKNFARLCTTLHDFARLCTTKAATTLHDFARLCTTLHDFCTTLHDFARLCTTLHDF